ncbi:MAG: hypothetical protein VXY61_07185 [Bacteroidota bacterium]|jgi:hypothetical protein|nr:hypothetical protein [Bacteroidota bacterium]MEC8598124.1 hypothetical protein [Bacteroidota bacterium]MED5336320.1 hypothetical protein [Bacteroidota bacterium]
MRRLPQSFCLIGIALAATGFTFKLNQYAGAHTLFNLGVAVLVVGLLLWAFRLLRGASSGHT